MAEMTMTNTNTNTSKLTKKDITKSWWIWYFGAELSNSYERLQSLIFCAAMTPVLTKLYPEKAELSIALKRHLNFFNTEGIMGCPIHGITIAMEEEMANGGESSEVAITGIKTGLMGPLAGMGDSIIWAAIMPLIMALFLPLAMQGNPMGGILPLILYPGITMAMGYYFYHTGYSVGKKSIIGLLQNGKIKDLIQGASVLGLFMMGALSASFVNISTPFTIQMANSTPIAIQSILDMMAPGLLPLAAVFGIYAFLKKKGPRYNIILSFIIGLSIITSLLGIL